MSNSPEINMAREFSAKAPQLLRHSPAFKSLAPATQQALLRDLRKINQSLAAPGVTYAADPYAFSLDTPDDFARHRRFPRPHRKHISNRDAGHVRLVHLSNELHISEHGRVPRVIDGYASG